MFFCGDYNARIGHLKDSIEDIDCVPQRHALDEVLYGHGESLVNFVKDCKLCILNGRLGVHNDNFTYISDKGKYIADYIIVPEDCYDKCTHFKVHTMNEKSEKCNVAQYLS